MEIHHFEKLYKTYQPGLVNFAFFYLKNQQEAIDLVQELFLNLWEKKDEKLQADNPKAYLYTAVKNRCYNKISRNKMQSDSIDLVENIVINEEDAGSALESKELEQRIHKTIESLPEKCKEIFVLSRFEQMSYKEIAEILNISVKTVESQISNALKILRKIL